MESEFLAWLRSRASATPPVLVGIGDDAAVLEVASRQCVVTTDMVMDGVDFRLDECDPWQVGRKALAVNLSDLAAMAARPKAVFVSLAIPSTLSLTTVQRICEGIFDLASEFRVCVAGGDTNVWQDHLAISITALGEPTSRGALLRSGARAGDTILVTGELGGSILGRHFDFPPRVAEAIALHERYELHAGIDVSDGLTLDLSRLAAASGCGAMIDLDSVPVSAAAFRLSQQAPAEGSPLDHALGDGEDFELILAVSPAEAARLLRDQPLLIPITRIGEMTAEPGLWQRTSAGDRLPLTPRGYEH